MMGKIEGIAIKNFDSLKEVILGRTFAYPKSKPLGNMTTIIGPSGGGKSTVAGCLWFYCGLSGIRGGSGLR